MADNTLKVHHLRPAPGAKTAKTRVGRGEASKGKTAGRGTKGTKARYQLPAAFEGGQMPLHMRLPKLKGFKNRFRTEYQVVNLDKIADRFPEGGTVGVDELVAKGLVRDNSLVKVLGGGDLSVKLQVTAAEHLDELATAHRAAVGQGLRRHLAARREQLGEPPDVDDLVLGLELRVREALELGQAPVHRHLAALEPDRHLVAGLGALGATARRLALGALATAEPLLGLVGTGGRPQVMQLQHG